MRQKIRYLMNHSADLLEKEVEIKGWVKTVRQQKNLAFAQISDGSDFAGIQVVIGENVPNREKSCEDLTTGAAVCVVGKLVESPGGKQKVEIQAEELRIIGTCDPTTYPLQKKRHSFEFLRTIAHLRPRTNTMGAVTRVRNALSYATHQFFQDRGFLYLHSPITTASDCEGSGEMFQVTTLKPEQMAKKPPDYSQDFFGKPTFLTVSGQLNAEIYASAFSDVYTFGPTFRAENSHTSRHLAEFWMIEPEMAFADLNDNMDNVEAYIKHVLTYVFETCEDDMAFFDQWVEKDLLHRLHNVLNSPFERITYTEAIEILEDANVSFQYPVKWGADLQSEHERYLSEEHFKKPVFVTDYPKEIKAFYMRQNEDQKTVAAVDLLVPKIGEIVGGSQREERYDRLESRIQELGMQPDDYWWYLELRKYGSIPHSGYGVGFERLIQFVTGMENIRDVIPFPRAPGSIAF